MCFFHLYKICYTSYYHSYWWHFWGIKNALLCLNQPCCQNTWSFGSKGNNFLLLTGSLNRNTELHTFFKIINLRKVIQIINVCVTVGNVGFLFSRCFSRTTAGISPHTVNKAVWIIEDWHPWHLNVRVERQKHESLLCFFAVRYTITD